MKSASASGISIEDTKAFPCFFFIVVSVNVSVLPKRQGGCFPPIKDRGE
nr:MAG TPA: hypothetical protein [Caudoviricetes sp.]